MRIKTFFPILTLNTKGGQFGNFAITGGTVSCRKWQLTVPPVMTKVVKLTIFCVQWTPRMALPHCFFLAQKNCENKTMLFSNSLYSMHESWYRYHHTKVHEYTSAPFNNETYNLNYWQITWMEEYQLRNKCSENRIFPETVSKIRSDIQVTFELYGQVLYSK